MRGILSCFAFAFAILHGAPEALAKRSSKQRAKDHRLSYRAAKPPKKIRRDPIAPPPREPEAPPRGAFRAISTPGATWSYRLLEDGKPIELESPLEGKVIAKSSPNPDQKLFEVAFELGGVPLDQVARKPPELATLPARLLFALDERQNGHQLRLMTAEIPATESELKRALATATSPMCDPPRPQPDVWKNRTFDGIQERRVDLESGAVPASCLRWGQLNEKNELKSSEVCSDLLYGLVRLAHREQGRFVELVQSEEIQRAMPLAMGSRPR